MLPNARGSAVYFLLKELSNLDFIEEIPNEMTNISFIEFVAASL